MPGYDPVDLGPDGTARIAKSAVTPRPIAWVSSVSEDGDDNLAPFSSYNYVSASDPIVSFTTPYAEGDDLKDTPRNAIETGAFAVNVVTEPLAEVMNRTSEGLPPEESEFDFAGVERADCERIDAPRVADADVTIECELYDAIRVRDRLLVLGEGVYIHVADRVLTDGKVDMEKLDTVGRLGGPFYTALNRMELER